MSCCPTSKRFPPHVNGREISAVRAVLRSGLSMIEQGAQITSALQLIIVEFFRNDLYAGYKTSGGVPATMLSQFRIPEEALEVMSVMVGP